MANRFDRGFDHPFTHQFIKEALFAVRFAKVMEVSQTRSCAACVAADGQSPGDSGSRLVFIGGIAWLDFNFFSSFRPPCEAALLFVLEDLPLDEASLATAPPGACRLRPAHIVEHPTLFV
jgi:hypothetical protein